MDIEENQERDARPKYQQPQGALHNCNNAPNGSSNFIQRTLTAFLSSCHHVVVAVFASSTVTSTDVAKTWVIYVSSQPQIVLQTLNAYSLSRDESEGH